MNAGEKLAKAILANYDNTSRSNAIDIDGIATNRKTKAVR